VVDTPIVNLLWSDQVEEGIESKFFFDIKNKPTLFSTKSRHFEVAGG